ncbi:tRNA pseudouridine38-40 synthase [Oikeobacillus pervagus]|uniref:tRNA pseudouridine synthase A n=1 Tax=Oikeobacillus pervagus TaxID=1325931 RepID=A0AAJ1T3W2_9BACI|nr:tRNA pseudouridine(38-40) synthase TruA [Oikeobacillus pervagus]MDQ0216146.1 tRNA pseudouridine38-40 synthase [Oikeobacillus pervagus]
MNRIKCIVCYDGTAFAGYQIQPNGRTIQGCIEKALKMIHKGQDVKVFASGRTDAGVHAVGQVLHFDSPLRIPPHKWPNAINGLLPRDIRIKECEIVDSSFHARFSASGKEYRYKVHTSAFQDPFRRNFSYHYPYKLDMKWMEEAAKNLIGTHDFTSFCSAKTDVEDKVRTIEQISIHSSQDELEFHFIGNGFLYNMVRILTGSLLDIGSGKISPNEIKRILEAKNRSMAGKTAPAAGLYLWRVFYDN